MAENIGVSRESLQISYRRFLSDSAAGFVLILILILAYYYPLFAGVALSKTQFARHNAMLVGI